VRISLGDVNLWFDVSGPSVVPQGDTTAERLTLVTVHGGPGFDHMITKVALAPLSEHVQVVFYDQRGHGRSDYGTAESWNLRTWADDLRRLCDALGLRKPVVLGSSFGGFVALTYAGLFPDHPGGIILANTTGGRLDHRRSVEIFRRLGGHVMTSSATSQIWRFKPSWSSSRTSSALSSPPERDGGWAGPPASAAGS
jgi:pimeloyl-ACP methyl ester carboxylesterase